MLFEGVYRRFVPLKSGKGPLDARLTQTESLAVDLVAPPNLEMTRAGRRFLLGNSAAATGIAPVQAIPTTVAQWAIWNADPSKTYFFEELALLLAAGTPGLGGSALFCVFQAPAQIGASNTGLSVQSASQGSLASKAIIKSAVTITSPAAPVWYQFAENASGVAAAAFSTGYANGFSKRDFGGAVALQPGQGLGLAVMAPAGTTPLYIPQARWVELETDME